MCHYLDYKTSLIRTAVVVVFYSYLLLLLHITENIFYYARCALERDPGLLVGTGTNKKGRLLQVR